MSRRQRNSPEKIPEIAKLIKQAAAIHPKWAYQISFI
jgi:hypothetical protein